MRKLRNFFDLHLVNDDSWATSRGGVTLVTSDWCELTSRQSLTQ